MTFDRGKFKFHTKTAYKRSTYDKKLIHDPIFLAQKSENATIEFKQVTIDLLDTLVAHKDGCVGMAANIILRRHNVD